MSGSSGGGRDLKGQGRDTYEVPAGGLARVAHLAVGGHYDEDLGSHDEIL